MPPIWPPPIWPPPIRRPPIWPPPIWPPPPWPPPPWPPPPPPPAWAPPAGGPPFHPGFTPGGRVFGGRGRDVFARITASAVKIGARQHQPPQPAPSSFQGTPPSSFQGTPPSHRRSRTRTRCATWR